jgi:hypothetical protein
MTAAGKASYVTYTISYTNGYIMLGSRGIGLLDWGVSFIMRLQVGRVEEFGPARLLVS